MSARSEFRNLFGLNFGVISVSLADEANGPAASGPVSPVLSFDFQGPIRRGLRTERSAQPWASNAIPLLQPNLPTPTDFKSQIAFYSNKNYLCKKIYCQASKSFAMSEIGLVLRRRGCQSGDAVQEDGGSACETVSPRESWDGARRRRRRERRQAGHLPTCPGHHARLAVARRNSGPSRRSILTKFPIVADDVRIGAPVAAIPRSSSPSASITESTRPKPARRSRRIRSSSTRRSPASKVQTTTSFGRRARKRWTGRSSSASSSERRRAMCRTERALRACCRLLPGQRRFGARLAGQPQRSMGQGQELRHLWPLGPWLVTTRRIARSADRAAHPQGQWGCASEQQHDRHDLPGRRDRFAPQPVHDALTRGRGRHWHAGRRRRRHEASAFLEARRRDGARRRRPRRNGRRLSDASQSFRFRIATPRFPANTKSSRPLPNYDPSRSTQICTEVSMTKVQTTAGRH